MKNKKLKLISFAILLLSLNSKTQAQWATINVQDFINRMYTSAQASGIKGSTDLVKSSVENLTRQSVANQEDTDARNRKALGENTARANLMPKPPEFPTVEQCIELTQAETKAPAVNSSAKNKNGGPGGGGPGGIRSAVKTNIEVLSKTLDKMKDNKTCYKEVLGAAGCTTIGAYAGNNIHPKGLKGNTENINPNDENSAEFKNYSLNKEGFEAAKEYVGNATYYDVPKVPDKTQLEKNQIYASYYGSLKTKLDAAHDTLLDVVKDKREGGTPTGIAGTEWNNSSTDYKKITGATTIPNKPSLFELTNYIIMKDYIGDTKADVSSINEVNKRLALSNYINWNLLSQQKNTNILLSHILVQLTTPISKKQVDEEYNKTVNLK